MSKFFKINNRIVSDDEFALKALTTYEELELARAYYNSKLFTYLFRAHPHDLEYRLGVGSYLIPRTGYSTIIKNIVP